MADTKFTPGSYWRTRKGEKSRIVGAMNDGRIVAECDGYVRVLDCDGRASGGCSDHAWDLEKPWREPRTVTLWCYEVYPGMVYGYPETHTTRGPLIAKVQVTEGEGLDGKAGGA